MSTQNDAVSQTPESPEATSLADSSAESVKPADCKVQVAQVPVQPKPQEAPQYTAGSSSAAGQTPLAEKTLVASILILVTTAIQLLAMVILGESPLEQHLRAWDGAHYLAIASEGYFAGGDEEIRLAFFPGLPALLWLCGVFEIPGTAAGFLLNTVASVGVAIGAMRLAELSGGARCAQIAAAVLITGAPMALTFHMVYTEAPFMLCAIWALVAMIERRWIPATAWVWAACWFRLTGIDLWLVLVLALGFAAYERKLHPLKALGFAAVAVTPLVGYVSWASWHTRDLGGYFGIQSAGWNSAFDFGHATLLWLEKTLIGPDVLDGTIDLGYLISSLAIVGAALLVALTWNRVHWVIWLFAAAIAANVLLSDGIMHSRPRLLLPVLLAGIPVAGWLAQRAGKWRAVVLGLAYVVASAWISAYMVGPFEWAI